MIVETPLMSTLAEAYTHLSAVKDGRPVPATELPMILPDGSPVTSVKQLAALMGTSDRVAACYARERGLNLDDLVPFREGHPETGD